MAMAMAVASPQSRFDLPGFSLPLNSTPGTARHVIYPNGLDDYFISRLDTHREILMIRALNAIPDKPHWDGKARRPCYEHARAGRLRCSMMRILPKTWMLSNPMFQYRRNYGRSHRGRPFFGGGSPGAEGLPEAPSSTLQPQVNGYPVTSILDRTMNVGLHRPSTIYIPSDTEGCTRLSKGYW